MHATPVVRRALVATVATVATVVYFAGPSAAVAGACSDDVFTVDGTRVGVELCNASAPGGSARHAGTIRVTVSAHGRRLPVQSIAFDPVASGDVARTIGDLSLVSLGVARTIHLTISVRGDDIRIEHALVLPGAVVLK